MKKIIFFVVFCLIFVPAAFSGNDTIRLTRSFGLQVSGFVRVDHLFDSRQTVEAVEGLNSFYPSPVLPDENGKDLNAAPKANLVALGTRLGTRFFAPDLFRAKSSAYIEFDFTGTSNTNGIRLRQAYVNLEWPKSSLLMGRAWHPLSYECPTTVAAFNAGAPFWVFNRSDQVRFNYTPGNWLLSAVMVYHSDFSSDGPNGKSSAYLRNAVIPEFAIDVTYKSAAFQTGIVGSIKTIKPRLFTTGSNNEVYKTDEKLTSSAVLAYTQYRFSKWLFKAQATYSQNMNESLMLGGYAVSSLDPATGYEKYTPTQSMTYWLTVDYGTKWQVGLFAGYIDNLGTLDDVAGAFFARAPDIKYMYRIAPHLYYNVGNWQFVAEIDYTAAAYGDIRPDKRAKVINEKEVGCFRSNLSARFFF